MVVTIVIRKILEMVTVFIIIIRILYNTTR